jgi:hypothetical protein
MSKILPRERVTTYRVFHRASDPPTSNLHEPNNSINPSNPMNSITATPQHGSADVLPLTSNLQPQAVSLFPQAVVGIPT